MYMYTHKILFMSVKFCLLHKNSVLRKLEFYMQSPFKQADLIKKNPPK